MIVFNCLAQKCTLPGQLSSRNKPFKINLWVLKAVMNSAPSTFSDYMSEVMAMGSVLKPVRSPGCHSERLAGAHLWSRKAVSLLQQVKVDNPGGRGLGVVIGYQE